MSDFIPDSHHNLLIQPLVATFISITPDGLTHGSVVWCRQHEGTIQVAILKDTQKYQNLLVNPEVSILIVDTNEPYRYLEVRGTASISTENASAIMRDIATKYDRPDFDVETNEHKRVIVTIIPRKIIVHG